MSYNRRDGGGRRSNDYGGGGNRRGGNYRSNYDNYQVNPWEGGMSHGGNRGSSGLLPSPYQPDSPQISSAEAQLAIASNLINKIFNQPQSVQPPPLLNFGAMGSGGRMSGFNNYQNRFQDRRSRMDNRRRSEPYKSALNRRMGSDRRNIGRNRNYDKTVSKSKRDNKDTKKDKDGEKTNREVNKPDSSDEKRDDDKDSVDSSGEKKPRDKKYPYVPPALLYCHVCSKNMWDQTSFSKHIKGRRHQIMLDGLSEKYKLQVELLRHEVKIVEQQREMEMERKKRQGMGSYQFREYCVMCDIHFYGNIISHRRNAQHQKLKEFLFPKCSYCRKEFSNRLEQDEHKLTWAHLQKVAEWRNKIKPEYQDDEDFDIDDLINPESINEGEMMDKDIEIVTRLPGEESADVNDDVKVKTEDEPSKEGEEMEKDEKEEKDEVSAAAPKAEIKYNSIDLDPSNLPKYNPALAVGQNLIKPVTGFLCRGCKKFMTGEEDFKIHCRTASHFNNYCSLVRANARVTARKKREENARERAEKAEKDGKEDETAESNIDDEGNFKRTDCAKNGKVGDANDEQMDMDEDTKHDNDTEQKEFSETDWNVVDDIDDQNVSTKEEEKSQEEEVVEEEEEVVPKTRTRGRGGKAKRGGK